MKDTADDTSIVVENEHEWHLMNHEPLTES